MSRGTHNPPTRGPLFRLLLFPALASVVLLAACKTLDAGTETDTSTMSSAGTTATTMAGGAEADTGWSAATGGSTSATSAAGSSGGGDGGSGTTTTVVFVAATAVGASLAPMVTTPTWTLYQETDPHIIYSTNPEGGAMWTSGDYPEASGGKIMWTLWRGTVARIKMRFNGTGIALVVLRNIDCCKARLSLDGGGSFLVDTYGAPLHSAVVWTSPDLAPGVHSLTIETTNLHNPSSADYYVLFDAVSVRGTLVY
jgi:hypothetical protein